MNSTHVELDLQVLRNNFNKLNNKFKDYQYKIINLRNNAFGMGYEIISSLIGGFDYILVNDLKEALEIRKINTSVDVLINEELPFDYLPDAINNNVSLTIYNNDYLQRIEKCRVKDKIKLFFLLDNGGNKIGFDTSKELISSVKAIKESKHLILKGFYTNITSVGFDEAYYSQINKFVSYFNNINFNDIAVFANEPIMFHKKNKVINGIAYDLSLFGLEESVSTDFISGFKIKNLEKKYNDTICVGTQLKLTFRFLSKIQYLKNASKGEIIGKNYLIKEDMMLAVIPIGYNDGITRAIKSVIINEKECPVLFVENNYLLVGVSYNVKVGELVCLITDKNIDKIIFNLNANRYYLLNIIGNNLDVIYLNEINNIDNLL